MKGLIFKKGLSGNALKIIALLTMTADHVGALIYPQYEIFRIIGRIAMPIFAFMIAEGCAYTRRKVKYFALVLGLGLICVAGYLIAEGKLYLNILITFSFSIAMIYCLQYAMRVKTAFAYLIFIFAVLLSAFLNFALPKITGNGAFETDYGFFGTLLPVVIFMFKDFRFKLIATCLGLTLIAIDYGGVQWWDYFALPFIFFYDGTRGKFRLKYFFYLYYPLHLVAIYGIYMLL